MAIHFQYNTIAADSTRFSSITPVAGPTLNDFREAFRIVSNRAARGGDSTNDTGSESSSDVPVTDYQVSAIIRATALTGVDTENIGVQGRRNSSADWYRAEVTLGGDLTLVKRVGGDGGTTLGSTTVTVADTTNYTITLRMVGNQISVLWNDAVVIGPVTDNSHTTAQKIAIAAYGLSAGPTGWQFTSLIAEDVPSSGPGLFRPYFLMG